MSKPLNVTFEDSDTEPDTVLVFIKDDAGAGVWAKAHGDAYTQALDFWEVHVTARAKQRALAQIDNFIIEANQALKGE
jgi:hypothetical protein